MRPIVITAPIFSGDGRREASFSLAAIKALMEGLCRYNQVYLAAHPGKIPPLYKSGTVYRPERGTENWCPIPVVLRRKFGDCEDLSCWRVAELRAAGVAAQPHVIARRVGRRQWRAHAQVLLPGGRVEDPSIICKRLERARNQ